MKPFLTILALTLAAGCGSAPPIASPTTSPADPHTAIFTTHLSADEIRELDHAVMDEGHQPWRYDPDQVAEAELMSHMTPEEQDLQGPSHAVYHIHRKGDTATVTIHWHRQRIETEVSRQVDAEVSLKNTRPGGAGCWYAVRIAVTRNQ
jgi:hypothetical protein